MKSLTINGEVREPLAGELSSLIAELGLTPSLLLVEYNGKALLRSEWDQVKLHDGDSLELMLVAAGG